MSTVKFVKVPAWTLSDCALNPAASGRGAEQPVPSAPEATLKADESAAEGWCGAVHGVNEVVVV